MKLFLDTANVEEIRHAARLGLLSGVTTNPSLMAKEKGADFKETIQEICALVPGPISAEVTSTEVAEMLEQGREIAKWAPNVVVKIPMIESGLEATSILSKEGIKVNMTLCFSTNQAILAATVGAAFVSPFVGRLDDVGHEGMELVADIVRVYRNYGIKTEVIAASLRHPEHVTAAARACADIATIPYKVLMQMVNHPLTDVGLKRFMEDWAKR